MWLNALWFAGLVLSLASAVIGITVKQRLNDHSGGLSGTSREAARLRQHRINRLIHSRVGTVVATVPVLLQLALALFLAGILLLLWNLHPAVASVASALTGTLLLFVLGTAILPMLNRNSFYLSPQALGMYFFWQRVSNFGRWMVWVIHITLMRVSKWIVHHLPRDLSPDALRRFLQRDLPRPRLDTLTWHSHERLEVTATETALDADLLATAYSTTMDPSQL